MRTRTRAMISNDRHAGPRCKLEKVEHEAMIARSSRHLGMMIVDIDAAMSARGSC